MIFNVKFLVLVAVLLASTADARRLKGSKGSKDAKSSKNYKGTKYAKHSVQVGDRPYFVIDSMAEGGLKDELLECANEIKEFEKSDWSIGHRGACLMYPEHTLESYKAALVQGAGIVECDVTFTKDRQLICRHAQCDLHTTTDVVARPELNAKCTVPFTPGGSPQCCASDFTLAEIKTLCAKMDARVSGAATPEEYIGGVASFRTTLYQNECPEVPTHMESIELIKEYGAKFTPELKTPQVQMPYEGDYTQEDYAQQMVDEYIQAGVDPSAVWPQSFLWDDAIYWLKNTDFKQAVALVGDYDDYTMSASDFANKVAGLKEAGVQYIAPPTNMLVALDGNKIVASNYAKYCMDHDFDIITWTLERSGPLVAGGGFYYGPVTDVIDRDGDMFELLHVLNKEVGIVGIFSDWPATTTFYANCMDL